MNLDQQLADTEYIKKYNWGKLLTLSKRQFDEWATAKLASHGYEDFRMAHMPILMNIKAEGTNNNELAGHARVTKQAMSKVAKELQQMGYIKSKTSAEDKRNTIFTLTERGKKLVLQARLAMKELMDTYRKEFGKEEFDRTLKLMTQIMEFTDQKLIGKNE
jgi:DNA-binding MarR family transcriptional regulator